MGEQKEVTRRDFLKQLGVTVGAAGLGAAGSGYLAAPARAAMKPKGNVPSTPIKAGHITFLTGPAELLGGPGLRGHLLAAEEINAQPIAAAISSSSAISRGAVCGFLAL